MAEKSNNKRRLSLLLLQESLWKIEDKMNIFLESIADHEAELIRLRRSVNLALQKLRSLENSWSPRGSQGGKNDGR